MLHSDDCQSNIQTKYFSFTKIYNEIKKSKSFIKYKPNFIKDLKCKLFFKHLYKKKSFVIRMGCLIKNILSFFLEFNWKNIFICIFDTLQKTSKHYFVIVIIIIAPNWILNKYTILKFNIRKMYKKVINFDCNFVSKFRRFWKKKCIFILRNNIIIKIIKYKTHIEPPPKTCLPKKYF